MRYAKRLPIAADSAVSSIQKRVRGPASVAERYKYNHLPMKDLPVVCTVGPSALATRRTGLLSDLLRRAIQREERPDGYRLQFAPGGETFAAVARVVDAERQCCRFLQFQITVEPDGGPIWLELTGPPGTGEFLAALLDS